MTARRGFTLLVALVASGGCRQILGADEFGLHGAKADARVKTEAGPKDSGPTFTGSCDGVEYSAQSCAECASAPGACCDAARACSAEPACNAMAQCLARCDVANSDCRAVCNLKIPQTPELLDLVACEAKNCAHCGAGRIVWGNAACDSCLQSNCDGALDDVSRDPTSLHDDRARQCDELRCPSSLPHCACDPYGADAPAASALKACTSSGPCATDCTVGHDFSCLDHVSNYPLAQGATELELHLRLVDAGTGAVLPTFRALACNDLNNESCVEYPDGGNVHGLGDGVDSDAKAATAAITIPRRASTPGLGDDRFFGHLYVLPTGASEKTYPPALLYFFPPLRTSPTWVTRRIVDTLTATNYANGVANLDWLNHGGIAFTSASCEGNAPGMKVTLTTLTTGKEEKVFYTFNLALEPDAQATSDDGIGFAWNVEPGQKVLTATVGQQLVGTFHVLVQKGAITYLVIRPIGS